MTESVTSSGTVVRITMLLRVLAEAEKDLSLSEIAEQMRLPASTTHRLLNLLLEQGFVERGEGNRTYRAGLEFLRLGGLVVSRSEVTEVAGSFMRAVVDACDETVMLSLYVPHELSSMICKVIYGSHPLRYQAEMYRPSSLAWGATGRGILAFLPDTVIDRVLAKEEPSTGTGRKMGRASAIKRELAHIAEQGYAHSHGQKIAGAVGLSAPIFNSAGVIGALCLTIPDSRFDARKQPALARLLMDQAARLSFTLGHRGDVAPAANSARRRMA
jgi:DNA-binding IclR family transcriptional regulator